METDVTARLRAHLAESSVSFREVRHGPTRTSEESAAARGEPLHIGGKALLLKIADEFRLFVLSAASQLDSAAIKQHFSARKLRFASPDELHELTGLVPGAVPPFGHPVLPFPLHVDQMLTDNERVAFNAGSLTTSFILTMADYLHAARPHVFLFSR